MPEKLPALAGRVVTKAVSQRVGQVAFAVACRMLEEHAGSREPRQTQAPGNLGVLL